MVFLAKRSSNLTFKVLKKESCPLLIDLRVSPLFSNHTNLELFLIPLFLAIPKTVPEIWVASVSLALFFLLFTHFTTFHKSRLKSSRCVFWTACIFFALIWKSRFIYPAWQMTCVLLEMWHFNNVNEQAILGSASRLAFFSFSSK